ncbi:MAG TPA: hypothetical protein VFE45_18925 [Coriobacteriia bacterium]|nr:hypothetical protein [Coriobacteriia bacterium]
MNDVVSTCQSTWKRLGVPARARADLEFELRTNLEAAASDGVDATTFVGGDPRGLAREWAMARGLVRARWLVAGPAIASFVAGFTSLTIFFWLFVGQGGSLFAEAGTRQLLLFFTLPASWLLIPALAILGLYLRLAHDSLAARTVIITLATSPITLWISAIAGLGLKGLGGAPAEPLRISLAFALLLGVIRTVIVAADRRKSPTRD